MKTKEPRPKTQPPGKKTAYVLEVRETGRRVTKDADGQVTDFATATISCTYSIATYRVHRTKAHRPKAYGRAPRAASNSRRPGSRRRSSRPAARSPGGADDDPGDPGPADLAQGQPGEKAKGTRHCLGCGHCIDEKRPQAKYCGDACRMAYVRAGKVAAKPVVVGEVRPLGLVIDEIQQAAAQRQAAWARRAKADPAQLSAELADLWHQARRARAAA